MDFSKQQQSILKFKSLTDESEEYGAQATNHHDAISEEVEEASSSNTEVDELLRRRNDLDNEVSDGRKNDNVTNAIRAQIPAVKGVMLAQTFRETYGEKTIEHGRVDKELEMETVPGLCRRLSLEDSLEPSELPLPEGAIHSQVLDEFMIRQIVDTLPPRAEGYPWFKIYSSEKNGFSLSTLYRKMSEWDEEMSPVLIIIRDVEGHVFGAVISTVVKPLSPPRYVGTGDSCLLFRFTGEYPNTGELHIFHWTGDNQFFVNATKDFLSVGAGGGHYGLWLDSDLNKGRSQKCETFNNEPLAGGVEEDFVIQFVEAFGFRMS